MPDMGKNTESVIEAGLKMGSNILYFYISKF